MELGVIAVVAQSAAAWYSAGFIWTMQILNYPLLNRMAEASVPTYETAHNQRFAAVVAPGVVVAVVTSVVLFFARPRTIPIAVPVACALLIALVIVSTVVWQAPAHDRLAHGFDAAVHAKLVRTNWIRTVAWTTLALLDTGMLLTLLRPVPSAT